MSAKWAMSGAESILKVYPGELLECMAVIVRLPNNGTGGPHGFVFFPKGSTKSTDDGLEDIKQFLNDHSP